MDKKLDIVTWSTVTGKILEAKSIEAEIDKIEVKAKTNRRNALVGNFQAGILNLVRDKKTEMKEGYSKSDIRKKYERY